MVITRQSKLQCPKCNAEMQDGRLAANGMAWSGVKKDEVNDNMMSTFEARPGFSVVAFRCPNCNYVELYTNEEEPATGE